MASKLTNKQIFELVKRKRIINARESFYCFRRYINKNQVWGWWQYEIAEALQQFYNDYQNGLKPKLVIQAPPQHGKTSQVVDFILWLSGKNPNTKIIYTSFSERLGIRANLYMQRVIDSEAYQDVFNTKLSSSNTVTISGQKLRNRDILEFTNGIGYFRNTTVGGAITGEGLDIGVIDDPIKGRKEANSATIRNSVWDWFTDDFFTRFSENGALLCVLTRWHLDDPIGRLIERDTSVKVLSYSAIATHDEKHRKEGDALFPEHKSLEFLLERKSMMDTSSWLSLYQQTPIVQGGEIIRGEWFERYDIPPQIKYAKIYADTAQKTKEYNDYSVFECWGYGEDNKIYLLDLIRGKWEAPELKRRAVDFWTKHKSAGYTLREMCVEDKASGTGLIQDIKRDARIPIRAIQRNTDKLTRLQDVLSYMESGYVVIKNECYYINDFIKECEAFTADNAHEHDDQIDPMIDAINDMLVTSNKTQIRVRKL